MKKENKNKYWHLSTKQPNFKKALLKIGVPNNELKYWDGFDENEEVFVFKIYNETKEKYEYSLSNHDNDYIDIEFMTTLY